MDGVEVCPKPNPEVVELEPKVKLVEGVVGTVLEPKATVFEDWVEPNMVDWNCEENVKYPQCGFKFIYFNKKFANLLAPASAQQKRSSSAAGVLITAAPCCTCEARPLPALPAACFCCGLLRLAVAAADRNWHRIAPA